MNIDIKYLRSVEKIEPIVNGDWVDLRTAIDVEMKANTFMLIPLGVAMKLPVGYEAILVPRSSTFIRYDIIQTNSIGVIDESYCGDDDEWKMPVYAVKNTVIPKGTRICQFRIFEHQPVLTFTEKDHLSDDNRGGFGSTGTN